MYRCLGGGHGLTMMAEQVMRARVYVFFSFNSRAFFFFSGFAFSKNIKIKNYGARGKGYGKIKCIFYGMRNDYFIKKKIYISIIKN